MHWCGTAFAACARSACVKKRPADWIGRRLDSPNASRCCAKALWQFTPAAANTQHYELPPAFFELCLGKRLKYSSCYYTRGDESLDEAEVAMLELYDDRAELEDGQSILELGCGWGSLTLWMAERYPNAKIVAVSNSNQQRDFIESQCRQRRLLNVRVITQDVNRLELDPEQFDRCVSVEMFEHMRNYEVLLSRIAGWLRPGGKLFVHIFAHATLMYPFETAGARTTGWGGISSPAV